MHLKESAYNFIYDDLGKDRIVFYNSRTGALAVVHEDQYKQYKGFQETGKEIEDDWDMIEHCDEVIDLASIQHFKAAL